MSLDTNVLIPLLVLLIVLSAFFSGSETALLGFDWLRLRYLARKGNRRARMLERILTRKDRLIGTILVGNNIANVAASAIATAVAIAMWGEQGIALATGAMTLLLLIFAEIAPKTFASRHSEKVGLTVAPVFVVLDKVLLPLVLMVTTVSNLLLRLFGSHAHVAHRPSLSEEEIRTLLSDAKSTADVAESKRRMLHGVFQISSKSAREIMIPRTRMNGLDITTGVEEAAAQFLSTGFTRLPVFREDMDHIAGVVHARDVLKLVTSDREASLASALRETFFVPETMTVETLLYEFQARRTHLAVVVDEFGGVEGLVTLEDVLEEIVGEIRDEHDLEGEQVRFLPGGEALVQGHATIRDLNQLLKLGLPTDMDVTIGGFTMTRLARIPEAGESFTYNLVKYTVERTGHNRVLLVRVTPLDGDT